MRLYASRPSSGSAKHICGINFTRIQAVGVEYTTRGRLQVCLYSTVGSRHHGKKELGLMILSVCVNRYWIFHKIYNSFLSETIGFRDANATCDGSLFKGCA